jgi:hypothetical protein
VNPRHLYAGTSQDNVCDMMRRNPEKKPYQPNPVRARLHEKCPHPRHRDYRRRP